MKTLNYKQFNYQQTLADWDEIVLPQLSEEQMELRKDLDFLLNETKNQIDITNKYLFDLTYGIKLKEYLDGKEWFNLRVAADINFWRYLSVFVVPNVVLVRWESKAIDRYWQKPARIWLRSIWWYAYLGWNINAEKTFDVLSKPVFNTDIILNTVERTGRKGTNIETYKSILHTYSKVSNEVCQKFSKSSSQSDTLFRAVMRLNTAKILVTEPSLCENGISGYVKNLFSDLGVSLQ
jgi:hypothetical protein